jgi:hypothetical protein
MREIEALHPQVRFDWQQILKGEEEADPGPPAPSETGAAPSDSLPLIPAHDQIGHEGVARLRARYADVIAALDRRVSDPSQREQLKREAGRLNPDAWSTPDEVRMGLEEYETVLGTVRASIGPRRRARRRSAPTTPGEPPVEPGGPARDEETGGDWEAGSASGKETDPEPGSSED